VCGLRDGTVHVVDAVDADRLEEDRHRGGGGDRLGDRRRVAAILAEDLDLAGVELGRGDEEAAAEPPELVRAAARGEHAPDVGLEPVGTEEARGQVVQERSQGVEDERIAPVRPQVLDHPRDGRRHARDGGQVVAPRHRQEVGSGQVRKRAAVVLQRVADPGGRHVVGDQRRDERPGAGADVEVEVPDRGVPEQGVERHEGADLVEAAGDAPAGEDQRPPDGPVQCACHAGSPSLGFSAVGGHRLSARAMVTNSVIALTRPTSAS
jgi:hypothetical protein